MKTKKQIVAAIKRLKKKLTAAEKKCHAAERVADGIRAELAKTIAAGIGLKIGGVVRVSNTRGLGAGRKEIVQRYHVIAIGYDEFRTNCLSIRGRTIRSDGTLGNIHGVWREWTVEKEGRS